MPSETPTLLSSEKVVALAGTPEPLVAASRHVRSVTIVAKAGNTGRVYVGGTDVSAAVNGGLGPGERLTHEPAAGWFDLAGVYLDVDTSGEGVDFYAIKA